MANLHRVDPNDNAIDQQPFGFVLDSRSQFPSGCLIHHGDWTDRTIHPPVQFWDAISSSGIGACFQTAQLPVSQAGKLTDIHVLSQQEAFSVIIDRLRIEFERYCATHT